MGVVSFMLLLLYPRRKSPRWEAGWAPEPVWTRWRREENSFLCRESDPSRQTCNVVTVLADPPRLFRKVTRKMPDSRIHTNNRRKYWNSDSRVWKKKLEWCEAFRGHVLLWNALAPWSHMALEVNAVTHKMRCWEELQASRHLAVACNYRTVMYVHIVK